MGLLTVGAGSAYAHTAQILIQSDTLIYQQLPGIDLNYNNHVTIALKTDSLGSYYEIDDPGSTGTFFPSQCTPLDITQEDVRCPAAGIDALYVRTGTGGPEINTTTDSITILAPTPATLTGGSVTNSGGPRTSDITAGPVAGNVLYGNPGSGTLNAQNGFPDTIHSCPGNTVIADPSDTVIPDCAPAPDPPAPPAAPASPTPSPLAPASPTPSPGSITTPATTAPSEAIAVIYKPRQRILRQRAVVLSVSVATSLTVKARGTITLRGAGRAVQLAVARARTHAGARAVTLRLRVPRGRLKALRRAFARHRRLYANVQVDASDPVTGSSYDVGRRVTLVR